MQNVKFSRLATVGQVIRGHDFMPVFSGGVESYVEGEVLETHCRERGNLDYKVRITARKLGGVDQPAEVGQVGYIPHEVMGLEWDERVQLVRK